MRESQDGGIFHMILEAAAGRFKAWAAFVLFMGEIAALQDPYLAE